MKQKKKAEKKQVKKPKIVPKVDIEEIEVKLLDEDDLEDVSKVMKKCSFEVLDDEILEIISFGMSFGATVNRVVVGVGLAWPARFSKRSLDLVDGRPNALFLEDPAVLLAFEGRGIRRLLIKEREREAKRQGFRYVVSYLDEDVPTEDISEYIKEAGSKLEMIYLQEGYFFAKTDKGVLAYKVLK